MDVPSKRKLPASSPLPSLICNEQGPAQKVLILSAGPERGVPVQKGNNNILIIGTTTKKAAGLVRAQPEERKSVRIESSDLGNSRVAKTTLPLKHRVDFNPALFCELTEVSAMKRRSLRAVLVPMPDELFGWSRALTEGLVMRTEPVQIGKENRRAAKPSSFRNSTAHISIAHQIQDQTVCRITETV